MPERSPIEEFHHRFQPVRAIRSDAETLAGHSGQVHNRRSVDGEIRLVDGAVDDAAHPDSRAGAALGLIIVQDEKLLTLLKKQVDQKRQLTLRVGPEDDHRTLLAVDGRTLGAKTGNQPIKDRLLISRPQAHSA